MAIRYNFWTKYYNKVWLSRLPVTGLALTSDDAVAYSVAKDGAIMRTDIEQGKRWAAKLHSPRRLLFLPVLLNVAVMRCSACKTVRGAIRLCFSFLPENNHAGTAAIRFG